MTEKIIFDELNFDDYEEMELEMDALFNNEYECKYYIVCGDIGLWDGVRPDAYLPCAYDSILSAITASNRGFNGYITVSEGNYGKLLLHICHHDGNNYLEIKELSKLGEEMYNNGKDIDIILNKKGATKNIRFTKKYLR